MMIKDYYCKENLKISKKKLKKLIEKQVNKEKLDTIFILKL